MVTFFCLNRVFNTTTKASINSTKTEEGITDISNNNVNDSENEVSSNISNASTDLDFSDILVDYKTWKNYHKENINLSTDFTGVDINGAEISKKSFLEKLKTGNYIPIKLFEADYMYQLYRIDSDKEKVSKSIKSISNGTYNYFLKEGKAFPEFDFKDLNGNEFSNEQALGNILVIKCWFLQCKTCIEEFPVINDLYDRYEGHDNVIFLSLAFDKPDKLKKFLTKKEFRYPVVAEQKDFIKNEIGIIQYPAHIIIDKYGDIHKIVNNIDSLILALDILANGEMNLNNNDFQ